MMMQHFKAIRLLTVFVSSGTDPPLFALRTNMQTQIYAKTRISKNDRKKLDFTALKRYDIGG